MAVGTLLKALPVFGNRLGVHKGFIWDLYRVIGFRVWRLGAASGVEGSKDI